MSAVGACDACLARAWLIARLAGHLDVVRPRASALLALADHHLTAAVGGGQRARIEAELAGFDAGAARERAARAGLELLCRCRPGYPCSLRDLAAPPAVLHVGGSLARLRAWLGEPAVAVVGTRNPSPYGTDMARTLARGIAASGFTLLSGMARGIDAAAHRGALEAAGRTVAVLAGAAELPYPPSSRALHARVRAEGVVLSELPPGTRVRRWMFPARNRLIAALGAMTVVVEARAGSGALLTAGFAAELGRPLGAVPGRVTSPLAAGPHRLLRDGALLVTEPADILEGLPGGESSPGAGTAGPARPVLPRLPGAEGTLLAALAEGHGTAAALAIAGLEADRGLATLATLELAGWIRREPGGRFSVLPI